MTMKRICSRCGKIVGYRELCDCKDTKRRLKAQKQERNNDDPFYKRKYQWGKLRLKIISRDNGFCQRCYYKYGIINDENLQVHHIKPRSKYPELTFDESNLVTLCKTCNTHLGVREELDFDWKKREQEDIIML